MTLNSLTLPEDGQQGSPCAFHAVNAPESECLQLRMQRKSYGVRAIIKIGIASDRNTKAGWLQQLLQENC